MADAGVAVAGVFVVGLAPWVAVGGTGGVGCGGGTTGSCALVARVPGAWALAGEEERMVRLLGVVCLSGEVNGSGCCWLAAGASDLACFWAVGSGGREDIETTLEKLVATLDECCNGGNDERSRAGGGDMNGTIADWVGESGVCARDWMMAARPEIEE